MKPRSTPFFPLALFGWIVFLCANTLGQSLTTQQQLNELIARLDRGESIENMEVNLSDVYFEFNSSQIDNSTSYYLGKVVQFLNRVSTIDLEISGHTDNVGKADFNQKLSYERALAVKNYLIEKGIDPQRITVFGYGMDQPIADNSTREGRALNRRVVFSVIKKQSLSTIQDLIILDSGDTLGVTVISVSESVVRYRSFSSDQIQEKQSTLITKVIFANGDVWSPRQVAIEPAAKSDSKMKPEFNPVLNKVGRFFTKAPHYYERGVFLLSGQYEFKDNLIGGMLHDSMIYFPPVSIGYERQLFGNLGLGLIGSLHMWGDPEKELRYSYGALTARLLYHPYVAKRINPYGGISGTVRAIQLNEPEWPAKRKVNLSYDWVAGCRFFPTRRLGLFGEISSDGIAKYSAGLVLAFGQLLD